MRNKSNPGMIEKNEITYNSSNDNIIILKICLTIFSIILGACMVYAQGTQQNRFTYSSGIEVLSSGNGHGAFYSLSLTATKGRYSLAAGPLMHDRSKALTGLRFCFSRNLSGIYENKSQQISLDLIQLNYFVYSQMNGKTELSRGLARAESRIHGDNGVSWDKVQVSTGEIGAGIGFQVNFSKNISWKNRIAAGVYHHFSHFKGMAHERTSTTLHLGTGLYFNI